MASVGIRWQTASPLWEEALKDKGLQLRFKQPAILRFNSDSFMEDLEKLLASDASKLKKLVVCKETWEKEKAGWLTEKELSEEESPLKLFQPAHGRFYLVSASLVCSKPGLPDRVVDTSKEEKISFVMRRLVGEEKTEYGWVQKGETLLFSVDSAFGDYLNRGSIPGALGKLFEEKFYRLPQGVSLSVATTGKQEQWLILNKKGETLYTLRKKPKGIGVYRELKGWLPVPAAGILENEERLPMFTLNFKNRDRQRRLLAGYIPVANRETFKASPKISPLKLSEAERQAAKDAGDPLADPRIAVFNTVVTGAAKALKERTLVNLDNKSKGLLSGSALNRARAEARDVLLFICLDFAEFLRDHLPAVWAALQKGDDATAAEKSNPLWLELDKVFHGSYRWRQVLVSVYAARETIYSDGDGNPSADIASIKNLNLTSIKNIVETLVTGSMSSITVTELGDYEEPELAEDPVEVPKHQSGDDYVIRCVYERLRCEGIFTPVISVPSRVFQLSPFFEPLAPTRPVTIGLPEDTGIAGLKKFKKNVSVMLSKKLRNQMDRMNDVDLDDLNKGDIPGESGWELGMICSLSIPIITICALLLLMIILQLLNIVFWWLPFFKICFPFPKKT